MLAYMSVHLAQSPVSRHVGVGTLNSSPLVERPVLLTIELSSSPEILSLKMRGSRAGKVAQSEKNLLSQHGGLVLVPRTHIKNKNSQTKNLGM